MHRQQRAARQGFVFTPNLVWLLTGVPPDRLLEWDRQGLLAHGRQGEGHRAWYSISDLKAAQALSKTLEEELDERTSTLRAAGKAKSDFMRLVVHELRTPLSVASGYLSMIDEGSLGKVPAGIREALAVVGGRLQAMDRLVQQLIDVARIEDGGLVLDLKRHDLRDLLRDAIALAQPATGRLRRLRRTVPADEIPVRGDRSRLLEILGNLISNAIKFSPEGGVVECSAGSDGTWATASIRDHGIGISKPNQRRLFAPFSRVGSAQTSDISGTGLGLYISRELARRHGGDVIVKSEEGAGSTFSLRLKIDSSPAA